MLSIKNKAYIKSLHKKKYREAHRAFLAEGVKSVHEAFVSHSAVRCLVFDRQREAELQVAEILRQARDLEIPTYAAGEKDIRAIQTTETFPGVLAVVEMGERRGLETLNFERPIIALDGVGDPGNLGTIIRTADWFGVNQIILGEGTVDPYSEKVVRSTMGSLFHVELRESHDLFSDIEFLRGRGYTVVSFGLSGRSVRSLEPATKTVYLFGSESHGIRSEIMAMSDAVYTIPGVGRAESLNVAVAAGIVLSHITN